MIASARDRAILGLILLAYLVLAALYATRVPLWNAPDEPAHYNFVASIAVDHRLPILQKGDYDQALLERLTSTRFPPDQSVATLRYESHQPPLYYLIAAPILAVAQRASLRSQVIALRLVTVAIGALVILAVFRLVTLIFPNSRSLPLGAAVFVAFIPMHLFMDAAIDNDALAELMLCLTLIVAVEDLRGKRDSRADLRAGLVAGLAILTKLVAGVSVVLVALGFVGSAFLAADRRYAFRQLPFRLIRAGVVTLVLSGWWVGRNLVVYGWRDPFGLRRHAEVVVGQPPTGGLSATLARQMLLTLFHSFWGQFGWMGIPFADRTYDAIAAGSSLIVVGMLLFGWRMVRGEGEGEGQFQRWALGLLAAEVILVVAGVVFYNLQYLQPQGRYLFPTLPALAIFAAAGIAEIIRERYVGLVLALAGLALAWLAIFSLVDVIGPAFAS